jgi:hypothetical protein
VEIVGIAFDKLRQRRGRRKVAFDKLRQQGVDKVAELVEATSPSLHINIMFGNGAFIIFVVRR